MQRSVGRAILACLALTLVVCAPALASAPSGAAPLPSPPAALTAVNRHPVMGVAYRAYLDQWRALTGNSLLMHFTDAGVYSQWGSWGALEPAEDTSSVKHDELVRYADGPPVARAAASRTSLLVGGTVRFTAASSHGTAATLSYGWEFSDGVTASGATVDRRLMEPGTVTATVTVTDALGRTSTGTVAALVAPNAAPVAVAAANRTSVVAGSPVTFTAAASSDPDRHKLSYAWAFSDQATSASRSVTRVAPVGQELSAVLTVTDAGGLTSQATVSVAVTPGRAPSAVIVAPASVKAGTKVVFSSKGSADPDGQPLKYAWSFSTLPAAAAATASVSRVLTGPVAVTLTVTDPAGLSGPVAVTVDVS